MRVLISVLLAGFVLISSSFAAVIAQDDGSNYGGNWNNGDNHGSGFAAWTLGGNNGHSHYIANQAAGNNCWGMWADNGANAFAYRDFNSAMTAGDTFSVVFGNNNGVDNGVAIGFSLRDFFNNDVWGFRFLSGEAYYQIRGQAGWFNTTISYHDNTPITINFTYKGSQKYDISITGGGDNYSGSDYDLSNANAPTDFYAYNDGSGHDMSFNNMRVTDNSGSAAPEPTTFAMLGIATLLLMVLRRKIKD